MLHYLEDEEDMLPFTEILCLPSINKIYCPHDLRVVNLCPFWVGK